MAKVTFDWINKLIIVDDLITALDVEIDLYSDWKEWAILSDNLKYLPAFSLLGWEPTGLGKFAGIIFFITNWWTLRPYEGSHTLVISWNVFWEWGAAFVVPVLWSYTVWVQYTNSNLAQVIQAEWWSGASAQELWEYTTRTLTQDVWLDETELHTALDNYWNKNDYKATTTIASNMRWTDNASTIDPDNTKIAEIQTKVDSLDNYDDTNVITAISSQTTDLKGASNKDLTQVFNNWGGWGGWDVDAIAEAVDIKITQSHGRGQYTDELDSSINYRS